MIPATIQLPYSHIILWHRHWLQATGGKPVSEPELGDDLPRGMLLMGDLDLASEEGTLMNPLDLAVINAPHLDEALSPWPWFQGQIHSGDMQLMLIWWLLISSDPCSCNESV